MEPRGEGGALGDQAVALDGEEAQVLRPTGPADRSKTRLAERDPGDRERVRGVALAWLDQPSPLARGQPSRHLDDGHAAPHQVAGELRSEGAATLDPGAERPEPPGPAPERPMPRRVVVDGDRRDLPAELVDRA